MEFKASHVCHWYGQDVPCCQRHKGILARINAFLGGAPLSFSLASAGQCVNCHNEVSKAADATNLG